MYLGQLSAGQEAVAHICKGIEILKKEREVCGAVACGGQREEDLNLAELSDAYCALAEIYLTDAWYVQLIHLWCNDNEVIYKNNVII